MRKVLLLILGASLVITLSFGYGLVTAKLHLPPYRLIKHVANSSGGQRLALQASRWLPADDPAPVGNWNVMRQSTPSDLTQLDRDQLEALGYLAGTEIAPVEIGVVTKVPDRGDNSFNLYTSGHTQAAVLMNMNGQVLHTWSRNILGLIDPRVLKERDGTLARLDMPVWRRVHMFENGDLLAVYSGIGMVKLDRDSNVIWFNDEPIHHDFFVDEEEDLIFALSRQMRIVPRFSSLRPVLDDLVILLDSEGRVLRRLSIFDAIQNSDFAGLLEWVPDQQDIFHTNSLEVLQPGAQHESMPFRAGEILISVRHLDAVMSIDLERESVVWALTGLWRWQHDPTLLENGNLLVFDNRRYDAFSRVLEVNPLTQEVVWAYEGTEENGFSSATSGAAQRLPNGNTLITESTAGRAFEVTTDGKVVWDFYNPARAGDNSELIATIFEMKRVRTNTGFEWVVE